MLTCKHITSLSYKKSDPVLTGPPDLKLNAAVEWKTYFT